MSSSLYDKGREGFLDGSIDWDGATAIKAALVKSSYTVNLATHDFYDDVSANVVGTPVAITSRTVTAGVASGTASLTFTAPTTGQSIIALVLYVDTGTPSTSRLIAYIDTGTGLPFTTNGSDVTVTWDTGANKIFKL